MYDFYKKERIAPPGYAKKILLIMRLTTLVLIISIMQVSASSFAQRITLKEKNASLTQLFKTIRNQTGYDFVFQADVLKSAKPVSIQVRNAELNQVLTQIFKDQPLSYVLEGGTVTVTRREPSFLDKARSVILKLVQEIDVRGRILDKDGNGLPGATISVKGGSQTAKSGSDGSFLMRGIKEGEVLVISYIGYQPYLVRAKEDLGNVRLEEAVGKLEEVTINKGYYTTKKELNTGSVARVTAAEIERQPVSDPIMALQGRISGLSIQQTSGIPGAALEVRLRGQNSIANGNDPLYIVDGVPFNQSISLQQDLGPLGSAVSPFLNIRPEEIESIDVLKDADATSIYGSRGANGVILITTKKGTSDKLTFDVNFSRGAGQVTRKLNLMNTQQYLEMRREGYKNDNLAVPNINTTPTNNQYDINGAWDQTRFTDWQELMIGETAFYNNLNTTLSGGNGLTRFLITGSYRGENTVFPGEYKLKTVSGKSNFNHSSKNKRFKLDFSGNYSNVVDELPRVSFMQYILMPPNTPQIYKADGELNWENSRFENPFAELKKRNIIKTNSLISNLTASYNLFDQLHFKISGGLSKIDVEEIYLQPFSAFNPMTSNAPSSRLNQTANTDIVSWIVEPQLSYSKTFGNHNFDAILGGSFQDRETEGNKITATGFTSDEMINNVGFATTFSGINTIYSLYRYSAVFARVGYNYKSKYILNLTGRKDGSSRFGPGNQFGNFGAVGLAWILSEEPFFKSLSSISNFAKLRASIGRTGNDQLGDYSFLSTYASGNVYSYLGASILNPTGLSNPYFGWETIDKIELGIELGLLKDRIRFNANLYRNRTGNQLVGYALASTAGFTSVTANLPAIIENKGLELELTSANFKRSNFSWETSVNISFPKNQLVSYPNLAASSYAKRYVIGEPLFLNFMYQYKGIDPNTGLYTFNDLNNDHVIDFTNDTRPVFVGQKYFGGLNNSFRYKTLSLDVFFQFVKQTGYKYLQGVVPGRFFQQDGNQPIAVIDRWRSTGDITDYQKYTAINASLTTAASNLLKQSDHMVVDASFIRFKNLMLGWDLPVEWSNMAKINRAKIYLQGQNLFTLTNYKGLDPENTTRNNFANLPPLRIFSAGVQLTF